LDKQLKKSISVTEAKQKLEYFCSYQERCHQEVTSKLYDFLMSETERDEILVHLIDNNFLNETRFACAFARGKHRIKSWGRIRIVNELKFRKISAFNIKTALKEFSDDDYLETFDKLAENHWESIRETNKTKKNKKFCDFLLRKGFESDLVYAKMKELQC
jgi:regulatory protein